MRRYIMYWHFSDLARTMGFRAAVQQAKALGFQGIELLEGGQTPLFSSAEEAREAGAILKEENMAAACYSVGTTLYGSDAAVEELKYHADLAAALGSPYLHHTLYLDLNADTTALSFETVCADILPRAVEVARYCKGLGITCLYEAQGMYFNGLENFGHFYRQMKAACDNVGICGDMGNSLFVGTAPADFFRAFAPEIRHVHVKDYRKQWQQPSDRECGYPIQDGSFLVCVPTGEGISDVAACMEALKTVGYQGNFAIEQELPYPEPYCRDAVQTMHLLDQYG